MKRRDVLKAASLAFVSTLTAGYGSNDVNEKETHKKAKIKSSAVPKKRKNSKVVVVGGGWAGLSLAKHVKIFAPQAEVVMVEKRDHFVSCPMSNEWLVDLVDLEFLTHSYIDASQNNNYTFLNATAIDADKKKHILKTSRGEIAYDYLVFAVGIEYDYDAWAKGDSVLEERLKNEYPAAFIPGSEHITLKHKIKNFKGGNFILTVPEGNYRCLAAPYERACLIADYFMHHNIDGKVVIMDESNKIRIKDKGFSSVFNELYKDHIEYMPSAKILKFDLDKKVVETDFDEIHFEDASFYPNVKAPYILEKLHMTRSTPFNRVEADINRNTYKVKGTNNIYVCGDARPMGFSKSGNTAFSEGMNVAQMIADEINHKTPKWQTPVTICFSLLSTKPEREISLYTEYKYTKNDGMDFQNNITDEAWKTNGLGKEKVAYNWAESMFKNMFY
ncbi:twin-arginine translocation pathway signal protein [Sulfurovum lithotrophicum]|uniref:Twin-arginine translocation pathway signal protein n=1 Tax=Sulfurovum lithotrophicum TaxID=206403 RepID=A0A7U4M2H6_9BACT|nr:FAD/NAD(P)-binding oxidoreductase [Sulfurovum lithotrophicum]AKF25673.1 twin-arginine translocation pathway signal protein [Sulfurovum lithotrophicum]